MITGKNYVGNRLSGIGTKTYKTFNPILNIENENEFVEKITEQRKMMINFRKTLRD